MGGPSFPRLSGVVAQELLPLRLPFSPLARRCGGCRTGKWLRKRTSDFFWLCPAPATGSGARGRMVLQTNGGSAHVSLARTAGPLPIPIQLQGTRTFAKRCYNARKSLQAFSEQTRAAPSMRTRASLGTLETTSQSWKTAVAKAAKAPSAMFELDWCPLAVGDNDLQISGGVPTRSHFRMKLPALYNSCSSP